MKVEDTRPEQSVTLDKIGIGETFMILGSLMMKVKRVSSNDIAVVNLLTGDLIYMDDMTKHDGIPVNAKAVIE